MATTDIGTKYNTQIPELSENADIQTALRIYHYGQSSEPTNLNANSIAGYLNTLESGKVAKAPTSIVAGASNDLNLKKTTGFYSATSAVATAGTNYPTYKLAASGADSATKYGGVLEVVNDGVVVYQTYHMINPGITGFTAKAWRGSLDDGVTWTPWKQALNDDHTHDARYYQKYTTGVDKNTTVYNATEIDSALSLKATLAGPAAFTGSGANAPTATAAIAADDNSTRLATTAFVIGQAASATPQMSGTGAVGNSLKYARENHVHPTDTSRAPLSSPSFTGTPVLPSTTTLPLYTGGTLSQSAVAMAAAIDGKPNTLLGNKSAGVAVPAGTKRIVIARDSGSGTPDATITPVEGDLWFW